MMASKPTLKKSSGVTLIELLIVMVLMGLLLSLVGPFTFNLIDSAEARNEKMQLIRWVKSKSFQSFTTESEQRFKFEGKTLYQKSNQPYAADWQTLKQFDYLFFTPQKLEFNKQGFPQPDSITYTFKGNTEQLELSRLLGSQREEERYE